VSGINLLRLNRNSAGSCEAEASFDMRKTLDVSFRQGCVTGRGRGCYFQSTAEVGEIEGHARHSFG